MGLHILQRSLQRFAKATRLNDCDLLPGNTLNCHQRTLRRENLNIVTYYYKKNWNFHLKNRLKFHSLYQNGLVFSVTYMVTRGQRYGCFHCTKITLSSAGPQYSAVLYTLVFLTRFNYLDPVGRHKRNHSDSSCKSFSLSTQQNSRILIFISENKHFTD